MSEFGLALQDRVEWEARRAAAVQKAARAAEDQAARRAETTLQKYIESEALADALSREVFLPLVEEFRGVLEQGGVIAAAGKSA